MHKTRLNHDDTFLLNSTNSHYSLLNDKIYIKNFDFFSNQLTLSPRETFIDQNSTVNDLSCKDTAVSYNHTPEAYTIRNAIGLITAGYAVINPESQAKVYGEKGNFIGVASRSPQTGDIVVNFAADETLRFVNKAEKVEIKDKKFWRKLELINI